VAISIIGLGQSSFNFNIYFFNEICREYELHEKSSIENYRSVEYQSNINNAKKKGVPNTCLY